MNLLLSLVLNQNQVPYKFYSEVELFHPSSKHRIDGLLFVNRSLVSCFNSNVTSYFNTHKLEKETKDQIIALVKRISESNFLLLDFSNGFFKRGKANIELIARKMMKYLDLPNSFLLCVGTNWSESVLQKKLPFSISYKNKNISTNKTAFVSPALLSVVLGFDLLNDDILNDIISLNIARNEDKLKKIIQSLEIIQNLRIYGTDEFIKKVQKSNLNKWLN